jgi:RNA polymerase sigma-70 factor (ECF subfamily)
MTEQSRDPEVQAFLEAARHGDRQALDQLLTRFVQPVYRFGMQMCRDEEDAKDVLQDTLFAAARTVGNFRGDASVSTWLYTIARSFCIKRRRKGKHAPTEMLSLDPGTASARSLEGSDRRPDDAAADTELGRALNAAIDSLEPGYKEVLLLRDVEGLTAPEVAEVLGLGVEAVKSRLHRARLVIREKLAAHAGATDDTPAAPGCVDVVTLYSKYLEGDVDASTCETMEKHLASCPRCSSACDSLRATLRMCKASGPEVPRHVQDAVRAAVKGLLTLPEAKPGP